MCVCIFRIYFFFFYAQHNISGEFTLKFINRSSSSIMLMFTLCLVKINDHLKWDVYNLSIFIVLSFENLYFELLLWNTPNK